jgi:hypothetical protein
MSPRHVPPLPMRPPAPPARADKVAPLHPPAVRNTWLDGFAYGERIGFVSGWRLGAATGAGVTLLLATAACAAAKHLGWL